MTEEFSIIGAGSSGLFLSLLLLRAGKTVHLYEKTGGVLKKFLIAGKGGLNLTHSENLKQFELRYNKNQSVFHKLLAEFSPEDLRTELRSSGVETFVGTSGRIFPQNAQAGDIQRLWIDECQKNKNFHLHLKHQLVDYRIGNKDDKKDGFVLEREDGTEVMLGKENIILAQGGGSYQGTGSDGTWMSLLGKMGVKTVPLKAINCGYLLNWSDQFKKQANHQPLKNISIKVGKKELRGEVLLTDYGIEGSAVYAMSGFINQEIEDIGFSSISLDLKPDFSLSKVKELLSAPRGKESYSNFLRKKLKLSPLALNLLKELTTKEEFQRQEVISEIIKEVKLEVREARPMDEAISTSGGVSFEEVDDHFMLKKYPGVYVIGEMLDWDAPTGGYLLQGCFSMAHYLSKRLI